MANKANTLVTKTVEKTLPPLYSQKNKHNLTTAYVKFFNIINGWRYYAAEYDPKTGLAFGLIQNPTETELGYFNLNEMQELNDKWKEKNLQVPPFERDTNFKPTTIGVIKERLKQGNPS